MPLNPRRKARIKQRAQRQAAREFRPQIRAARKGVQRTKKARARDLRSVPRAAEQLSGVLAEAQAAAKGSGLKGRYLQQTLSELNAMQGDTARMIPFEQRAVRQEWRDPMISARGQLTDLKVGQQQTASDSYAAAIAARKEAQAKRNQAANEGRKERGLEVKLAVTQAQDLLQLKPPEEASKEAKKAGHPVTAEDWILFTQTLAGKEGIGYVAAKRAVAILQKQLAAQGKLGGAAFGASVGLG